MKKDTTTIKRKSPITISEKPGKYNDDILFPQKVEEANQRIAKYGLPDVVKNINRF